MTDFAEKYINPFTDYGFKKLFGEEPNKDLLLDFLNQLLKDEQGEIRFTPDQVRSYEDSLKYYRDLKNSLDTARDEGKIEGKIEVAKNLLKNGVAVDVIMNATGMTEKQIDELK